MADATIFRDTPDGGAIPKQSTVAMRANTLVIGGTIACIDTDGRAAGPAAGRNAIGIFRADYDNRTTAPEGGGAGAINAEILHGVFGFGGEAGHLPAVGDVCYVADNQTVSTDSDSESRGIAGYCVAVEALNGITTYYVFMSPAVAGQIVIAAAVETRLTAAEADIDDLQTDCARGELYIPITACTNAGAPLVEFSDGETDGLELVDSEMVAFRWNPGGTVEQRAVLAVTVPLPQDLDAAADVVVHLAGARIGAADTTTVLAVGAFFQTMGAAYTAAANCGGNTTAWDAATTVMAEKTVTIAAADVPAAPCLLTLTIEPSAALDADDFVLCGLWLEYTRALTAT
jgi:hypothetical protein